MQSRQENWFDSLTRDLLRLVVFTPLALTIGALLGAALGVFIWLCIMIAAWRTVWGRAK